MYSTCLFCHADLGRNEALEHFPVGRRLAYDAAKGRLWVVCRRCERWNLTLVEERWEAIDEAERLFRATALRASTANVGLARVADGTELVRIGAPLRPELAAWRYGDQFGRRRRLHTWATFGVVAPLLTSVFAGPGFGAAVFSAINPAILLAGGGNLLWQWHRYRARVPLGPDHATLYVDGDRLRAARLIPLHYGAFALEVAGRRRIAGGREEVLWRFEGTDAVGAAAHLLAAVNLSGGSRRDLAAAVRMLEDAPSVDAMFWRVARSPAHRAMWRPGGAPAAGTIAGLAPAARLALEMVAHEVQERRAMEGELAELERAWQTAEEIGAIADDLLFPTSLSARLAQLRARSTARAGAASRPSSDSGSASSS